MFFTVKPFTGTFSGVPFISHFRNLITFLDPLRIFVLGSYLKVLFWLPYSVSSSIGSSVSWFWGSSNVRQFLISLKEQKFFILIWSILRLIAICVLPQKPLPTPCCKDILLCSSRSFLVLVSTFKSMIHIKLMFV